MSTITESLVEGLKQHFGERIAGVAMALGEITITVPSENIVEICTELRDAAPFAFEQLMDLCGVDYLEYGNGEWSGPRFGVVYHLLSLKHNHRLRVKTFLNGDFPRIRSITNVWSAANWYEREAFDLFGILFQEHPDLRRILTDYGFIGHPFRRDFPLIGNVEMRYDPEKERVVYEPVSIEPRVLVPRVIRHDNRYEGRQKFGVKSG